jgi:hypothetical protein
MDIFKNYAAAQDRSIERRLQWMDDAHERGMEHVREIIASGRVKKIKTIRDVSMNDTELALDEMGFSLRELVRDRWNV